MSERGYIAIERGYFEHEMFAHEAFTEREAFMWLIMEAAWKDRRVRRGRLILTLRRGELAHSERFIAQAWRWHRSRVTRFLKRLVDDAMVELKPSRDASHITICNYDKFQRRRANHRTTAEPLSNHSRTTAEPNENKLNQETIEEGSKKEGKGARFARSHPTGTTLAPNWQPSEGDLEYGRSLGLTSDQIAEAAEEMRLWAGGNRNRAVARKADWSLTFKSWMRRNRGKPNGNGTHPQRTRVSAGDTILAGVADLSRQFADADRERRGSDVETSETLPLIGGRSR
jgi:hypothetical protein